LMFPIFRSLRCDENRNRLVTIYECKSYTTGVFFKEHLCTKFVYFLKWM
jgi:hypothetical protein